MEDAKTVSIPGVEEAPAQAVVNEAAAGVQIPQTLAQLVEDTRYIEGRALVNSGKYDAAIEHFASLLEIM